MSIRRSIVSAMAVLLATGASAQVPSPQAVEVPGSLLRYSMEGSGPSIVAFTGSENIGRALYSTNLRGRIRLIYADPSAVDPVRLTAMTMDSVLDDIERVRRTLGVDRIGVMGHSMFGPVALEYALRYPDHSRWAILSGTLPYTGQRASAASRAYWDTAATSDRKAILASNLAALRQRTDSRSPAEAFWDQYVAYVPFRFADPHFDMMSFAAGATSSTNVDFISRFWGGVLNEYDNTASYSRVQVPVLVVAGRYDFSAPFFLWNGVGARIPDYTFKLFDNAGHNPMLEVPAEFDSFLLDWLARHQ